MSISSGMTVTGQHLGRYKALGQKIPTVPTRKKQDSKLLYT